MKKVRVDLLLANPSTLKVERVPAWEWDGKVVKELNYRASNWPSVTWGKIFTKDDGMAFMNALHDGVWGTFVRATEPYEVTE